MESAPPLAGNLGARGAVRKQVGSEMVAYGGPAGGDGPGPQTSRGRKMALARRHDRNSSLSSAVRTLSRASRKRRCLAGSTSAGLQAPPAPHGYSQSALSALIYRLMASVPTREGDDGYHTIGLPGAFRNLIGRFHH